MSGRLAAPPDRLAATPMIFDEQEEAPASKPVQGIPY